MGAAVHAGAGPGRTNRDRAARGIAELGSVCIVGGQARPAGDLGLAWRASRSAGAASCRSARMGCGRSCCTGWGAARSDVGRRTAGATCSCAAPRGGCALRAASCPDVGRRACGRSPIAAASSATTTTTCASRCRAGAGRRSTRADVGISRACGRCARTGLELSRRAFVGCRPTSAVRAARSRLGCTSGISPGGHAPGAFME
jgi:hypothetical protein